jgi:hypothetical protein
MQRAGAKQLEHGYTGWQRMYQVAGDDAHPVAAVVEVGHEAHADFLQTWVCIGPPRQVMASWKAARMSSSRPALSAQDVSRRYLSK